MNTITQPQAIERVDRYIAEAVAVLPSDAVLTPSLEQLDTECIDPTDNGPRNRIQVSKSYFVDGIPKQDNEAHVAAVRQWWTSHGFRVLDDVRTAPRRMRVEHSDDGFRMALREGSDGALLLSATSPCIWPDGTPIPEP